MATELFSFKLLIHGYCLDPAFYQRIGSFINVPGFAIQLFDYPTFILYSRERLYDDQIGYDNWIRFGNGKSTAFEMSEEQMIGFVNDRPLIINFIDAENKQVRVFSKVIVTLQAFKNDLQNYLEKNQENWKRKVFLMFDEAKNQVGKIDLSLSLAKKRQEILEKAIESNMNPSYNQSAPIKPQIGTTYIRTISEAPNRAHQQQNELALKSRSRTDGFASEYKSYDEIEPAPFENRPVNEKSVTFKTPPQENREAFAVGPPTLKTIVEGHYCPPVMVYQKKKKLVRFASGEEEQPYPHIERTTSLYVNQENRPLSSPNKGFRSTEQQKFSSGPNAFKKSASSVSYAENVPEPQARPVVVLSNKESEKLVDLYNLKNSNQEGTGLLDLLIRELVNLKTAGGQPVPDNYARSESLQIGSLRKDAPKDVKQSGTLRRPSLNKESAVEKNKENQDSNNFTQSPKKIKNDGYKNMRKSLDVSNQIIKETYEEANQPEEEYSQIFESISASQSLPKPFGGRKGEPVSGRQKNNGNVERMESIGESYPEDFEQYSAASVSHDASRRLSRHPSKGPVQKDMEDSRDVSEDIVESGSRIYGHSNSLTKNLRKDYGVRESIRSEYSEDFEVLSEDNY